MSSNDKRAVRAPPALNPEQVALTQPWKEYVSLGLIQEINLKITPMGTTISMSVPEEIIPASAKALGNRLAPGQAKQFILASGLVPTKDKTGGKKSMKDEALPVRSLTAKDFENLDDLPKRLKQVADKLGPSTALGRIGSLKLHVEGATSFEQWWSKAKSADKARLVMDQKHLENLSDDLRGKAEEFFGGVPSPFRGPFPDIQTDDEEKETKPKKEAAAKPRQGKASAPKK